MSSNDSQQRKEALDRRDKVQEVISQYQGGQLPSTADITQSIDQVTQSGAIHDVAQGMSPAGKKVAADTEKVLLTTKKVLEDKNAGDELQTALLHGAKAMKGTGNIARQDISSRDAQGNLVSGSESVQQLAQEAARRIWNVSRLTVSSKEFRRLISDLLGVLQDAIDADDKPSVDSNTIQDQKWSEQQAPASTDRHPTTSPEDPVVMHFSAGEVTSRESGRDNEPSNEAVRKPDQTVDSVLPSNVGGIQLSEEQRNNLVSRFKKIMLDIHASDEFQSALDDLLEITRTISRRGEGLAQNVSSTMQKATDAHQSDLETAQNSGKRLVENFANGKSLDPLINSVVEVGRAMRNDEQLHTLMDELNAFMHRSFRETEYIETPRWNNEANGFLERGRQLLHEHYRLIADTTFNEARDFANALQRDEVTSELVRDLEQLTRDLFLDENGKPTIKFDVVKDFVKIVPIIAAKLEYLALPRIDYSDDEYDATLDNVVLRCTNIIPRHLRISTDTHIDIQPPGTGDKVQDHVPTQEAGVELKNRVDLTISEIRVHAPNMAFYFHKKTGIAKIMDVGYADLIIPDKGLELRLTLSQADSKDNARVIKVENAKAKIHEFKLKLHDTKHDFLYKFLSPIINNRVKRQAEKAIAQRMTAIIFQLDQQLGNMSNQASQLRQQAGETTTDTFNVLQDVAVDTSAKLRRERVAAREE